MEASATISRTSEENLPTTAIRRVKIQWLGSVPFIAKVFDQLPS